MVDESYLKPTRIPALIVMVALVGGCAGQVSPSADTLARRLRDRPATVSPTALAGRGFVEVVSMGGPRLIDGKCYEKARAHPLIGGLGGVYVVRVCLATDSSEAFVFGMHTHGEMWTEYFPNRPRVRDTRGLEPVISESTKKRLKP